MIADMWRGPNDQEHFRRELDSTTDALERFMLIFLGIIAAVVFVVAVLMISAIGDPSSDLFSRLYVAVVALLIIGTVTPSSSG